MCTHFLTPLGPISRQNKPCPTNETVVSVMEYNYHHSDMCPTMEGMEIKLQEVLNREMKSRNESVRTISKETGIPTSTLHNWIQGVLPSAKNIHFLDRLGEYFNISISVLLFNKEDSRGGDDILFSSTFVDGPNRYKIIIEKEKR